MFLQLVQGWYCLLFRIVNPRYLQQFLNSGMSVCLRIFLSVFLFVTSSMLVQLYSSYGAQFIQKVI